MNRRPGLVAPVLVMAGALIVIGGIATGLSGAGETPTTGASPIALQEKETVVPTTAAATAIANGTSGLAGAANATPTGTAAAPEVQEGFP